jgi:hypothetical protein
MDGILAKQQNDVVPSLGQAWRHYFPFELPNLWVAEKTDNPFIGLLRYSFYRPRDIISYMLLMQDYVKLHEPTKASFTERSFRGCQAAYSDYLLGEVKDHLSFYYSNADFDELTGFFQFVKGRNRFNWPAFESAYTEYRKTIQKNGITLSALKEGPESFIQFLYSLNIIAYDERSEDQEDVFVHWCFRDRTPVRLNPKVLVGLNYESRPAYFVHPGLARALKLGGGGVPPRRAR